MHTQNTDVKKFSDLSSGLKINQKRFIGEKIRLAKVLNTEIVIHDFEIKPSKYPDSGNDKCVYIQLSIEGKKYVAFSIAKVLMSTLSQLPENAFPFTTKIISNNDYYEFT